MLSKPKVINLKFRASEVKKVYFFISFCVVFLVFFIFLTVPRLSKKPAQKPPPSVGGSGQYAKTTYTHPRYHFSITYPSDWQFLDEPHVFGIEIQKINAAGQGFSISLRVDENPQSLSLYDYAKSQAISQAEVPEKVVIGDLVGYKLHKLPTGLMSTVYLPYKPKQVLYFFAGGEFSPSQKAYYEVIVQDVLSSIEVK